MQCESHTAQAADAAAAGWDALREFVTTGGNAIIARHSCLGGDALAGPVIRLSDGRIVDAE